MVLHRWIGLTHREYTFAAVGLVGTIQIALLRWVRTDALSGITLMCVATLAYLIRLHLSAVSILNSLFLFLWGLRITVRGLPPEKKKDVLFGERPACEVAINKSVWIWLLCAPTVYYATMDLVEEEPLTWVAAGSSMCVFALLYDAAENTTRGVHCRNPYALCSSLINWGLFLTRPSLETLPFALGFFIILYFAPGGACWEESSAREKCNSLNPDSKAIAYRERTSAYFPLPPAVLTILPDTFRRIVVY